MSTHAIRNAVLVGLAGMGGFAFLNTTIKPSRSQSIAGYARRDLDEYNSHVQNVQNPRDTLFDRTKIMHDVKERKPWNMTYAEKEAMLRSTH